MTLTILGWVYIFCFFLGVCFTAGSFFLVAGGGGEGHGDGHGDVGGKDIAGKEFGGKDAAGHDSGGHPDYPIFSPLNIALALTTFGGAGTVMNVMGMPTYKSFPVSAVLGLATWAVVFFFFFKIFRVTQGSSEAVASQLVGKDAAVSVAIPENGLGEVSYVARGARYNAPARAEDNKPMAAGAGAVIARIEDGVCIVKASVEEKLKQL